MKFLPTCCGWLLLAISVVESGATFLNDRVSLADLAKRPLEHPPPPAGLLPFVDESRDASPDQIGTQNLQVSTILEPQAKIRTIRNTLANSTNKITKKTRKLRRRRKNAKKRNSKPENNSATVTQQISKRKQRTTKGIDEKISNLSEDFDSGAQDSLREILAKILDTFGKEVPDRVDSTARKAFQALDEQKVSKNPNSTTFFIPKHNLNSNSTPITRKLKRKIRKLKRKRNNLDAVAEPSAASTETYLRKKKRRTRGNSKLNDTMATVIQRSANPKTRRRLNSTKATVIGAPSRPKSSVKSTMDTAIGAPTRPEISSLNDATTTVTQAPTKSEPTALSGTVGNLNDTKATVMRKAKTTKRLNNDQVTGTNSSETNQSLNNGSSTMAQRPKKRKYPIRRILQRTRTTVAPGAEKKFAALVDEPIRKKRDLHIREAKTFSPEAVTLKQGFTDQEVHSFFGEGFEDLTATTSETAATVTFETATTMKIPIGHLNERILEYTTGATTVGVTLPPVDLPEYPDDTTETSTVIGLATELSKKPASSTVSSSGQPIELLKEHPNASMNSMDSESSIDILKSNSEGLSTPMAPIDSPNQVEPIVTTTSTPIDDQNLLNEPLMTIQPPIEEETTVTATMTSNGAFFGSTIEPPTEVEQAEAEKVVRIKEERRKAEEEEFYRTSTEPGVSRSTTEKGQEKRRGKTTGQADSRTPKEVRLDGSAKAVSSPEELRGTGIEPDVHGIPTKAAPSDPADSSPTENDPRDLDRTVTSSRTEKLEPYTGTTRQPTLYQVFGAEDGDLVDEKANFVGRFTLQEDKPEKLEKDLVGIVKAVQPALDSEKSVVILEADVKGINENQSPNLVVKQVNKALKKMRKVKRKRIREGIVEGGAETRHVPLPSQPGATLQPVPLPATGSVQPPHPGLRQVPLPALASTGSMIQPVPLPTGQLQPGQLIQVSEPANLPKPGLRQVPLSIPDRQLTNEALMEPILSQPRPNQFIEQVPLDGGVGPAPQLQQVPLTGPYSQVRNTLPGPWNYRQQYVRQQIPPFAAGRSAQQVQQPPMVSQGNLVNPAWLYYQQVQPVQPVQQVQQVHRPILVGQTGQPNQLQQPQLQPQISQPQLPQQIQPQLQPQFYPQVPQIHPPAPRSIPSYAPLQRTVQATVPPVRQVTPYSPTPRGANAHSLLGFNERTPQGSNVQAPLSSNVQTPLNANLQAPLSSNVHRSTHLLSTREIESKSGKSRYRPPTSQQAQEILAIIKELKKAQGDPKKPQSFSVFTTTKQSYFILPNGRVLVVAEESRLAKHKLEDEDRVVEAPRGKRMLSSAKLERLEGEVEAEEKSFSKTSKVSKIHDGSLSPEEVEARELEAETELKMRETFGDAAVDSVSPLSLHAFRASAEVEESRLQSDGRQDEQILSESNTAPPTLMPENRQNEFIVSGGHPGSQLSPNRRFQLRLVSLYNKAKQ